MDIWNKENSWLVCNKDKEAIYKIQIYVDLIEKIKHNLTKTEGFRKYTGIDRNLGIEISGYHNTPLTTVQLMAALAMSKHPLILEMANSLEKFSQHTNRDASSLVDAKVLKGIKILDLGCGEQPTFARCSRYLGADVYTVDVIPAEEFLFNEEFFPKEQRKKEVQNHICLDLRTEDALERILEKTNGDFDLVTLANICSAMVYKHEYMGPPKNFMSLIKPLLKEKGLYFCSDHVYSFSQKEEL